MVLGRPLLQACFVILIASVAVISIVQVYHVGSDVLPKAPKLTSPAGSKSQRKALNRIGSHPASGSALLVEFSLSGAAHSKMPLCRQLCTRWSIHPDVDRQASGYRWQMPWMPASLRCAKRCMQSRSCSAPLHLSLARQWEQPAHQSRCELMPSSDLLVCSSPAIMYVLLMQDAGPYSSLRILIAVTSTCCSASSVSAARREAARATWVGYILEWHNNTDIRFVLAQPAAKDRSARWTRAGMR